MIHRQFLDIDNCVGNPCLNGATCVDGVNSFTCTCVAGFTGVTCEESKYCSLQISIRTTQMTDNIVLFSDIDDCVGNPCLNGGTCVDGVNSFSCTCAAGFTGAICNGPFCMPNPCQNGGSCSENGNGFTCACTVGFGGSTCALCNVILIVVIQSALDLAIVVDYSESLTSADLNELSGFVQGFIHGLNTDNVQVAFVVFTHEVFVEFQLDTYNTSADMISHLNMAVGQTGGTNTGAAIEMLHTRIFQTQNGDRPLVPNVAILITDGHSNNQVNTFTQADTLRNMGVRVIVISVGDNIDPFEINYIASDPDNENVFQEGTYDCINRKIDVAIVVDNSESVHDGPDDLDFLMNFVSGIILDSDVDSDNVNFALSVFTHNVYNEFYLNNYTTKAQMLNHIQTLDVRQGGTNTGLAIENLNVDVFTPFRGDRSEAPNVAVIVTDGKSNDNAYTVQQATIAKANGIHMIVVGIGMDDESELHQIASEPTAINVVKVDQFSHLFTIEQLITNLFIGNCTDCINFEFDIAIVVDNSESVHDGEDDMQYLMNFVSGIITDSDVDSGNVKFSLSVFTHDIFNEFYLNSYTTRSDMLNHIQLLATRQGGTNTGGAIQNLNDIVFTSSFGDRFGAPNIAVIITDGKSNNNTYTVQQAAIAKANGIHIIAVGIGIDDQSELHQMASEPTAQNVFNVQQFSQLLTIKSLIEDLFITECTEHPDTVLCNGIPYNPQTHVCCLNHTLIEILNANVDTCCGTTLHDPSTSICCGVNVVQITNVMSTACCGTTLYNPSMEICCSGTAVQMRNFNTRDCCNYASYDNSTELCCYGHVVMKSSTNASSCCGHSASFDSQTQICCNGSVVNKRGANTNACCENTSAFDPTVEVCCSGNPVYIIAPNKRQCCGSHALYDSSSEICCSGTYTIIPRRDLSTNMCCNNTVAYDGSRELCCGGNIVSKAGKANAACCSNMSAFDTYNEVCCNGNPVTKINVLANMCCGNYMLYNNDTHVCCNHTVVPKRDMYTTSCCGNTVYDQTTELCCSGNPVAKRHIQALHCCEDQSSYDPNTEICCGGSVYSNQFECCGLTGFYDQSNEICCNGTRHPLTNPQYTECCGTITFDNKCKACLNNTVVLAYDDDNHMCCDGVIREKIFEYSCCCGQTLFDSSIYSCCNGTLELKDQGDTSKCCHCINFEFDIAIVVDNSESVHDGEDDMQYLMNFVSGIITDSDVDSGNVKFSLSVFTHDIFNEFYLNSYTTRSEMLNHIQLLATRQGGTNTGGAIQNLNDIVFTSSFGDRFGAPNIAVIITDGKSNNNTYTVQQAAIAKANGIHIIAVGIGIDDQSELHQMASEPTAQNVFNVQQFSQLLTIKSLIEDLFITECTGIIKLLFSLLYKHRMIIWWVLSLRVICFNMYAFAVYIRTKDFSPVKKNSTVLFANM
ncbi:CO6A4-like protein [Mya arenaria]|uniref:CO6A4-like protein n=1 Tax=Mya arenaria TaxID=6604 RepID=A0ABY7FYM5_MYAAR|nr:CO6A4-like protein [Mya arenaria]